jgi:2-polyprenyl-3-methyl-5-hydroxy-6-metoxy-1,4-benzoquinol methylase
MSEDDARRYTADIDMRNVNDSHTFAVAAVRAGSDVLDIGAADGSVARMMVQAGCRVWGVEYDPDAAELAREWCEDVVVGDLELLDLKGVLGRSFDVILFLDILEHLKDPLTVLRDALSLLTESGYVVISLPNVAHSAMRAQLLSGRFSYTEMGLLDATHLRFFDPLSVRQFLTDAGLVVLDEARVTFPIDGTEIPVDLEELDPGLVEILQGDPESDSYQFLFVAAPAGSAAAENPPFLPARVLQRELRAAQEKNAQLEALVGVHGSMDRQGMIDRLQHLVNINRVRRQMLRTLVDTMNENTRILREMVHGDSGGKP